MVACLKRRIPIVQRRFTSEQEQLDMIDQVVSLNIDPKDYESTGYMYADEYIAASHTMASLAFFDSASWADITSQ